jgi:hypothetical protein
MTGRNLLLFQIILISFIIYPGCESSLESEPEPDERRQFEIRAYDYSINHYFLDTIYASRSPELNFFNRYYDEPIFVHTQSTSFWEVKDLEVWKSITGLVDPGRERRINAFTDLNGILKGEYYGEELKDINQNPEIGRSVINKRSIKLTEGVDFFYNPYVGFISFKTQVQRDDNLAVAFRIQGETSLPDDDLIFGEFVYDKDDTSAFVLKLIKPANLQPEFSHAWKLQLKNIYPVGSRNILSDGFQLEIYYRQNEDEYIDNYGGLNFLEMFGLDKTNSTGTGSNPDGKFDFFDYRTIITKTGEIIFPVLEPFGKDLPGVLPDSMAYQEVYVDTRTEAHMLRNKDRYVIRGKYNENKAGN